MLRGVLVFEIPLSDGKAFSQNTWAYTISINNLFGNFLNGRELYTNRVLLNGTDIVFYFGNMLIICHNVECHTRPYLAGVHFLKLSIPENVCDCESIVWVDLDNLLESSVYRFVCFIWKCLCWPKLYVSRDCDKKWDIINLHDVHGQHDFPVYLRYRGSVWDPHLFRLLSNCLALENTQIRPKDVFCCNYILLRNWTVW